MDIQLGSLGDVAERVRDFISEWDRFVAAVEAQGRDCERLRSRLAGLEQEHHDLRETHEQLRAEREQELRALAELRAIYETLREDHEDTQRALKVLREGHETRLREGEHVAATLESLLRRLRP